MDIQKLKKLIEPDAISFSVLSRILEGQNEFVDSDYENFIICFSISPYPIWLWTKDGIAKQKMISIVESLAEKFPLEKGYSYNLKQYPADYILENFQNFKTKMTLVAYQLDNLNELSKNVDGKSVRADLKDLELLTDIKKAFAEETNSDIFNSREEYRNSALEKLENSVVLFWQNSNCEKVACTAYTFKDGKSMINNVYTLPSFRRMGYAEALVHEICKISLENNHTPTLYADLEYFASNSCYQKLGFEEKGRIVTIKSI